ncbi:MAG: hypothetical protein EON88_12660, partial [Brevundimonas sp.]
MATNRPWRRAGRSRAIASRHNSALASQGIRPFKRSPLLDAARTPAMPQDKKIKKVVLAYSGGLDTSIILKWLQ